MQGGLITRSQALAAGYSEGEIRTHTRAGGPWVPVRRGVYAEREVVAAVDRYDGTLRLRDLAAHLTMTRPHLMSHDSAARAHGLAMLRPEQDLVHVTRFGVGGSRTEEGVKHHLTRLGLLGTSMVETMRVTGVARTALDIGREHGFQHGVVACDAAMQLGADAADFESELVPMTCWPGITRARAAAAAADPGAESPGETLTRLLLLELDLGIVETQFPVQVRSRVFWADLRIGCHLFEFDGRRKFLRREVGGFADLPVEEILWDEKRRQDAICGQGLGMSRVTWAELFGPARKATAERLRSEYELTRQRLGDQLPAHLARVAEVHNRRGHSRLQRAR